MPVPHDRPTFDQIMRALRSNGESGDILCTHAAEEIERLTLTDEEREAIAACAAACENAAQYGIAEDARRASTLRALLARTTL